MKTIEMKLGNGYTEVSVPEKNLIGLIQKDVDLPDKTEEEVILEALANPIGRPRLKDIVKKHHPRG